MEDRAEVMTLLAVYAAGSLPAGHSTLQDGALAVDLNATNAEQASSTLAPLVQCRSSK